MRSFFPFLSLLLLLSTTIFADEGAVCGHPRDPGETYAWRESVIDPRYHTYEEVIQYLDSMATQPDYAEIVDVREIGLSTNENLPILAAKISDNPEMDEDEPALLFLGQCHAEEILGLEITIGLMDSLLHGFAAANPHILALIENLEIWIVPTYNPEGLRVVHDGWDVTYRKNKTDNNGNGEFDFVEGIGYDIDGVDLNRNYDFNWIFGDGYVHVDYDYFRGFEPFSESEERAVANLARQEQFIFSVAYHSARSGTPEIIYYPWEWEDVKHPPDYPILDDLAQTLAARIINESGDGNYATHPGSSRRGNAHDWFYTQTGCFQYLIEVGTNNLQPAADLVEDTIDRNLPGCFFLLDRALGFPTESRAQIRGIVRDASDGFPLESARVSLQRQVAGEMDEAWEGLMMVPRRTDEFGRYRRIVLPGTYTVIFQAPGFRPDTLGGISASDSYPTVLDHSLVPRPQRVFNLHLPQREGLTNYEVVFAEDSDRDTLLLVPGDYQIARAADVLDLTVSGALFFPETYHIHCDSFPDGEPIPVIVDLTDRSMVLSESFQDLQGWSTTGSSWSLSEDQLVTNTDLLYQPGDNLVIRSPQFGTANWERIGFTIRHAYELEWERDSIAVLFRDALNDTLIWRKDWVDQNWTGTTETYFHVGLLPQYTYLELILDADSTVEYRGWQIDSLAVFITEHAPVSVEPREPRSTDRSPVLGSATLAPNPLHRSTVLDVEVPVAQPVEIRVFDLLGRTVVDESLDLSPGGFRWVWSGQDRSGNRVPAGVYLIQVQGPDLHFNQKMLLLNY